MSAFLFLSACSDEPIEVIIQPPGVTEPDPGTTNPPADPPVSDPVTPATYTVSGTVSGLSGSGLVLQNNGGDNKSIAGNGGFTFTTALDDGASYVVSVLAQPGSPTQTCSITNASGTISGANITNVSVACITPPTPTYTISGNVSGLSGSGLVLQNNGGDNLSVSANGGFTFPTAIANGQTYSVTVQAQPASPAQTCTVNSASGTVNSANVTNVAISCATTVATYSVSGTVAADIYTYSDSDINDTYAPSQYHISNNNLYAPQVIGNPAKVGGYATAPGAGNAGSSSTYGDYDDVYRATLSAGDSISLYTANTATGNYWLLLSDPATPNMIEAWSQTGASVQTVTAPASKDYIIWVYLNAGASNYLLTVGNVSAANINQVDATHDNFVPGELLVTYKSDSSSNPAAKSLQNDIGMEMKSRISDRVAVMDFSKQLATVMQKLNIKKQVSSIRRSVEARFPAGTDTSTAESKRETLQVLQALRARSDIESVDLNYIRKPMGLPDANPDYSKLWHYDTINMPQVWNGTSITGNGTIVAVLDTGNRLGHPDMAGQFVAGYDFISSTSVSRDGDGIDANPEDPGDNPGSSSFHGTHVAGTIAAANNSIGMVGVAYGTKIMPLRVLGQGGGTDSDIIQAMRYAAGLSNNSGTLPAQKADVINMSLGGAGSSSAFQQAVNEVRAAGVIVIAAAGNSNTSAPHYPAAYDGVVSVSAVAQDLTRASYSNYGTTIDVAAPGGDGSKDTMVYSTLASDSTGSIIDTYASYQGTSMATPHVAAVAALMKQANPAMTPADFDGYLANGSITDDHGAAGRDNIYGHGLINAAKAVTVAGTPIPAYFQVDPSNVVFVGTNDTTTINVANGGNEVFSVAATTSINYTSGSNWLAVNTVTVDANNLGSYQLIADRTGLADGEYQATVTFSAPGSSPAISNYVVNVTLRVGLDAGVDAGYTYIAIKDFNTGQQLGIVEVTPVNGLYSYSFSGIPAGDYRIVAGTDMDNSGYFCDTGEACGEYSSSALVVNGDVSGINFTTGFTAAYGVSAMTSGTSQSVDQGFSK
ncbi:MAG: S8 family serine peptidase [Gammaproteobacteria bacterium]|nr:S8 family serine peptidase [Gammaproteobacteria bacterium]